MSKLVDVLKAMGEIYGRQVSPAAASMFLTDLSDYSEPQLLKALQRCRKELPRFPTVADVVSRIDDGRPGVEEAWGMIPKDEYTSVVWTEEMQVAYGACAPLLAGDQIAARMAFKERYEKAVSEARYNHAQPKWNASFGFDKNHRETVLIEAIQKNRIAIDQAKILLPEIAQSHRMLAIEGKVSLENESTALEVKSLLPTILKQIPKESA